VEPGPHLDCAQTGAGVAQQFVAPFEELRSRDAAGAGPSRRVTRLGADDQGDVDVPVHDVPAEDFDEVLRSVATDWTADPTAGAKPDCVSDPACRVVAAHHQDAGCRHGVDPVHDGGAGIGKCSVSRLGGQIDRVDHGRRAIGHLADRDEYRCSGVDRHRLVARPFETTTLSRWVRASTIAWSPSSQMRVTIVSPGQT